MRAKIIRIKWFRNNSSEQIDTEFSKVVMMLQPRGNSYRKWRLFLEYSRIFYKYPSSLKNKGKDNVNRTSLYYNRKTRLLWRVTTSSEWYFKYNYVQAKISWNIVLINIQNKHLINIFPGKKKLLSMSRAAFE